MSRVRCESCSSCEDNKAKIEDDGREGEAEGARGRHSRVRRRHVRRYSCSRSAARAAMQVVLLELNETRAEQGDDLRRRWPMQVKRASANAAPAEETVRWRAACVAGPAVHVRWCVGFGLGRVGLNARTGGYLRADRARARARAEAEAVARDRIGTEL